jgi:teichuronic acid biosynthesis glycosyltransferase TuaH
VYLAGDRWNRVPGTDRRLSTALARHVPVLWVDPPFSHLTRAESGDREPNRPGLDEVAPGVTRLRVRTLPGASRPLFRPAARRDLSGRIMAAAKALSLRVDAVIVASASAEFPAGVPGARVLYVTDDWEAGAQLMGLDPSAITAALERNLRAADVVAAVSTHLASALAKRGHHAVLLPNGCEVPTSLPISPDDGRALAAVLVGQLNERLDMDLLDELVRRGVPLTVFGPRTDRNPEAGRRLDAILSASSVEWLGEISAADLPSRLAGMGVEGGVGLAPYADSAFNRASFPLKVLEYLAAGLPVVSTDLPALRWLATDLIDIVPANATAFVDTVERLLRTPVEATGRQERHAFAQRHTWDSRARQLLSLVGSASVHS